MKSFDLSFINDSCKIIAGIDEAGRGPLAGPVVAAAVIFDDDTFIEGVNDSKKLTEKKRNLLFDEIINKSISYGIGIVDNNIIDEINILQATFLAMKNATNELSVTPDLLLIDGNKVFNSNVKCRSVIKGDSKSFSIAAASILAKVTRDRIMEKYSSEFPMYSWERNKGYGTKEHREAIIKHGSSSLHRKTFLTRILEYQQTISF